MSGYAAARTQTPPELVIERIARTIADQIHPRRIILIGSRARGDARPHSDYDVVVELEDDGSDAWERTREIYGLFRGNDWELNVFVRRAGEIERAADDPGTVDWDIVRQGQVLYAAKGVSAVLSVPAPRYVRERPGDIPPSVRGWQTRARQDLEQARRFVDEGELWHYACFFAQQSAEKYLKALLVRYSVRPKWIHKLEELLKDARAAGIQLPGLDQDCELLTPYAVKARYGALEEFDEPKGRAALAAAERIATAIVPLLN